MVTEIRPFPRAAAPARLEAPGADAPRVPAGGADGEDGGRAVRDRVTLSDEARRKAVDAAGGGQLDPAERAILATLARRDAQVRAHEAAHQSAGGELTGGASFSYEQGPDGKSYAVGGEVPIASRSGRTPDETIAMAQRVRRAALAPADPSAQDLSVASAASAMESAARAEKARATRAAGAYGRAGAAANGERSGDKDVATEGEDARGRAREPVAAVA